MTDKVSKFLEEWKKQTKDLDTKRGRLFGDNLEVELSESGRENTLRVNAVKSNLSYSGEATKFFEWLAQKADEYKFNVTLCAQPFGWAYEGKPSHEQLVEWVSRFGFKSSFTYEDGLGTEMVRNPSKKK